MVTGLTYRIGDATQPQGDGQAIIAHICNDAGVWERGFVKALSARWPGPEAMYRQWAAGRLPGFALGAVMIDRVDETTQVANMVAQHGVAAANGREPIRYDALERCLETVAKRAQTEIATVHMPRIGTGLAGGRWEEIEPIIERALLTGGVPVVVYDPPQ